MPFRNITLKDAIPPSWRRVIYPAWAVIAFILGAIWVWVEAADTEAPAWLVPFGAVWLFVGVATNAIAGSNVDPEPQPRHASTRTDDAI